MQRSGTAYTVLFAGAVCVVCSLMVSFSAVSLKERQRVNALLDKRGKVLAVSGLAGPGEGLSAAQIQELFKTRIEAKVVDLRTGEYAPEGTVDPVAYDQTEAAKDPKQSMAVAANRAQVRRVPYYAVVYLVMEDGKPARVILPVEGKGLWSTLYGFLALDKDCRTIQGLTFYQHGETPGLGGEVDNPLWKAKWPGRWAYDEDWNAKIHVIKGAAGPPDQAPYSVDGLSGATLTSRGVSDLLAFWLGDQGFKPYLKKFAAEYGSAG